MISTSKETYILDDIPIIVDGKYEYIHRVTTINSGKVPKDHNDIINIITNTGKSLLLDTVSKDILDEIIEEIAYLDIIAYEELNEDYTHYIGY